MPFPVHTFLKKVNSGLVAEYLFNNNVLDTSGNGYNGINNNVTFGPDRKGNPNSAGVFNGTNAFVNIDSVLPGVLNNTKGSTSYWLKANDVSRNEFPLAFGATAFDEYLIDLNFVGSSNGQFRGLANLNGVNQWVKQTTIQAIFNNTWVHIVKTHDGVEPQFYIDGSYVPQNYRPPTLDTSVWFSSFTLLDNGRIGGGNRNNFGDFGFYSGSIDDVRIYDRDLSLEEIQILADDK